MNSLFYNLNIYGIFFGFNNFWISVYLKLFSLKCFEYIICFIVIYILGNYLECLDDEIYIEFNRKLFRIYVFFLYLNYKICIYCVIVFVGFFNILY